MREYLVLALFACFFAGALVQIGLMLARQRRGREVSGFRLLFFFMACLMLVCLGVLALFDELSAAIWVSDASVVLANLIGWVLSFARPRRPQLAAESAQGVRAYTVYYQGQPLGLVTKEGFERLVALKLLRRQRTVELVDDYQLQARRQGARIALLQNPQGTQTLIKVEEEGGETT